MMAVIFLCESLGAQDQIIYNRKGKERGYESSEGDTVYYYDSKGRETGFSRNIGGETLNFDLQGREKGYSETYGGTTYHFNKQGHMRGYTEDYPHNEGDDFIPGGAYWGFSGPPEKEDTSEEKE